MWNAYAEYEDGTVINSNFPYNENGIYNAECERQYELEEWLITSHPNCMYYSVTYIGE